MHRPLTLRKYSVVGVFRGRLPTLPREPHQPQKPVEVHTKELKALFFVKDYDGLPQRAKQNEFDPSHPVPGRRIKVMFADGESLVGTTTGFQPGRPGFFLVPADTSSNTERCFVVAAATREISFI